MTTKVIVQPGRCVRHDGVRRFEGDVLHVCDEDLKAWTKSGDVAEAVSLATPFVSATPEQVYEAISNMATALQEAGIGVNDTASSVQGQAASTEATASETGAPHGSPAVEQPPREAVPKQPAAKSTTKAAKA